MENHIQQTEWYNVRVLKGADSIGAMGTFAPLLFKVLGREHSFAPLLFGPYIV